MCLSLQSPTTPSSPPPAGGHPCGGWSRSVGTGVESSHSSTFHELPPRLTSHIPHFRYRSPRHRMPFVSRNEGSKLTLVIRDSPLIFAKTLPTGKTPPIFACFVARTDGAQIGRTYGYETERPKWVPTLHSAQGSEAALVCALLDARSREGRRGGNDAAGGWHSTACLARTEARWAQRSVAEPCCGAKVSFPLPGLLRRLGARNLSSNVQCGCKSCRLWCVCCFLVSSSS